MLQFMKNLEVYVFAKFKLKSLFYRKLREVINIADSCIIPERLLIF